MDWSEQRARRRLDCLFGVIGMARDTLHREAPELALHADHVIIDGPPRVASLLRSALLVADLALIPAQPSPFDGWALVGDACVDCRSARLPPPLAARFVLNRCPAGTVIARETAQSLADHDPPALAAGISQCVIFAGAARGGQLVFEQDDRGFAARDIAALAAEIERPRHDRARPRWRLCCAAVQRSRELDQDARSFFVQRRGLYTAWLTVDITPSLRGRIKIAAFRRGVTGADMLRELLAREFPDTDDVRRADLA